MSGVTAAGAQPPNQPPGGDPSKEPPDKPMFNSWTENTKIKTCKCTVCDERVRNSSQKCDRCGRHVCSDCLNPASSKDPYYRAAAKNRMEVGCWACNWRSNMNPAFAHRKPAPEIRTEEERRAKASKALGAQRKAAAQIAQRSVTISSSNGDADSASITEQDADLGNSARERGNPGQTPPAIAITDTRQRLGIKRKNYTEEVSDGEIFDEAESNDINNKPVKYLKQWVSGKGLSKTNPQTSTPMFLKRPVATPEISPLSDVLDPFTDLSTAPHMEGLSTVIVGAGVVGLFVAYELALKLRAASIKHDITVVEIRPGICGLASGACAGILSTSGMPDLWSQIANQAQEYWRHIISSPNFSKKAYVGHDTVFRAENHGSINKGAAPSWFNLPSDCSLVGDFQSFGRVDQTALASWLFEQCKALNVGFLFDHSVSGVEFATNSALTHVYVDNGLSKQGTIQCQNLVLAAGPFTTQIFDTLFTNAAVELENHIQGAHSLHVTLNGVANEDTVALRLPDAAKDVPGLENEITMMLLESTTTVVVSATSLRTFTGDLEFRHARDPRKSKTSDLRRIIAKYLNREGIDLADRTKNPGRDRFELSTANGRNPIIDRVPASALGRICHDQEDLNPCGVWLCYGFGLHGTTLAPGAARMLVSRMIHGTNGVDNYDFSLPEYAISRCVGKGKSKAMG